MKRTVFLFLSIFSFTLLLFADEGHHHGPAEGEKLVGKSHFPVSCSAEAQQQFDLAVAMLHSFWFEESEKAFAHVAEIDPGCAMAYWGIAMSLYHPLWAPPSAADLQKGTGALEKAKSLKVKTDREQQYLDAIGAFYNNYDKVDHASRAMAYKDAMEKVYQTNPKDTEAAVFYALALDSVASPKDKTYANQKKAMEILTKVRKEHPDHPGVAHYIIHCTDFPPLAQQGLEAARAYAKIAPAVPHALHMPSHIFTRLGLWDESIQSNLASEAAGIDYARKNFPDKTWDETLHAMDYLMYAYLQKGQDIEAKKVLDDTFAIKATQLDVKAAYALAAIPARYALERRQWNDAAKLEFYPADFPWDKFPWSASVVHFARGYGFARLNDAASAQKELAELEKLRDQLRKANDGYGADQIEIERLALAGWIALDQKKNDDAEKLMRASADLESTTEKNPVTPGAILPSRELLGDLLMELKRPKDALVEYEASLKVSPNRLNGLYGAAYSAELVGDKQKAQTYNAQLVTLCNQSNGDWPAVQYAKKAVAQK